MQEDEYIGGFGQFYEWYYQEFVIFKFYVQCFLYGVGNSDLCMKVLCCEDVKCLWVQMYEGVMLCELEVVYVDLYFFDDVDLVILNVELLVDELVFEEVQELMYCFGCVYFGGWDVMGSFLYVLCYVEWLDCDGCVLVVLDGVDCEVFIQYVYWYCVLCIVVYWVFLFYLLLSEYEEFMYYFDQVLCYWQVELYCMLLMVYLVLNELCMLVCVDFICLGFVVVLGEQGLLLSEGSMVDFEVCYCWDQFWYDGGSVLQMCYLCLGKMLVVVGWVDVEFFCCCDCGVLVQFCYQYFMIFLIVYFQKVVLLVYLDCLVEVLWWLDIGDLESVKCFKCVICVGFEGFLCFMYCYWFYLIFEQVQVCLFYVMCLQYLEFEVLYVEVKQCISDFVSYLEVDSLCCQVNIVVWLMVVMIFGLIGMIMIGFFGMNLLVEVDVLMWWCIVIFMVIIVLMIWLMLYMIVKFKCFLDFFDVVLDEWLFGWMKLKVFLGVWFYC